MLFEELNQVGHVSGIFGIIALFTVFLLSIIILNKAIETKQRILYLLFFSVILAIAPWYPSGLSYIYWLIAGKEISYQFYVLLGTIFIPISIHIWLIIYMTVFPRKKKNLILTIYACFSLLFYIYLFYFLFFALGAPVEYMIGIKRNPIDITYKGFVAIYLAISGVTAIVTGLDFSIKSMKSEIIEVKWKGRFFLCCIILSSIGGTADAFLTLSLTGLVITKIILLLSSFFYYLGFIIPKFIKKILNIT
ncbi:MAG: hypothetical protein ACFFAN_18750 [Promethearchaeota archaeon]